MKKKRRNPIHAYKHLLAKDYDWDYGYLIALEKKKLQRMHDYFKISDIAEDNKYTTRDLGICLKLIDIFMENDGVHNTLLERAYSGTRIQFRKLDDGNYAMGRHSYAAAHWQDIVRYSQDVLTEAQKKHNALDIRREIAMHLQFQDFNFCIPHYLKEIHSPMDLFLTFITENSIETVEKLLQYERIEVFVSNEGHIEYALASFFYTPCHKVCRTHFNGKEELIPYFDTWQYDYSSEGKLKYKKVKRPLDKFRIEPWAAWSINEECIVEDNIENYNRKE